jgi:hypothetical protein
MDDAERSLIERACERLVVEYCHLVDGGEASKIADQFTEDGVWTLDGHALTGRSEMRRAFQAVDDNKSRALRHVCTNIVVDVIDANNATGLSYLTLFQHDGPADRAVSQLEPPVMLGEYRDRFTRTDAGWRFTRRDITVSFRRMSDSGE